MFELEQDECGAGDPGDRRRVEADAAQGLEGDLQQGVRALGNTVDAPDHLVECLVVLGEFTALRFLDRVAEAVAGVLVAQGKSTMRMDDLPLEWWSAGAIVSARLGEGYAFLATALGTVRHQGVDAPPPDTVEGMPYALPQQRCLVDARRLAAALADATPATRVSPWYGYSPLNPAHLVGNDGTVFVKDTRRSQGSPAFSDN